MFFPPDQPRTVWGIDPKEHPSRLCFPPPYRIWTRLRGPGHGLERRNLRPTAFNTGIGKAERGFLFCQVVTTLCAQYPKQNGPPLYALGH